MFLLEIQTAIATSKMYPGWVLDVKESGDGA
jgi:hypothetical protein